MTRQAPIPCPGQRGRKQKPRRACAWCNRYTTHFRRLPDRSGYECSLEDRCTARKQPLRGMGVEELLRRVTEHRWNMTRAALEIGVTKNALVYYLDRHAPLETKAAREAGLIRRNWRVNRVSLDDADTLRRTLHRYNGERVKAAKALGVGYRRLVEAMARLCPGEFQAATESRRGGQRSAA